MTVTQMDQDEPTPEEYSALLAVLEWIGRARPPIPLWRLSSAGLTAADLKLALHSLAARGSIRVSYRSGMPNEVLEVRAEAGRLAAKWTATRSCAH